MVFQRATAAARYLRRRLIDAAPSLFAASAAPRRCLLFIFFAMSPL